MYKYNMEELYEMSIKKLEEIGSFRCLYERN